MRTLTLAVLTGLCLSLGAAEAAEDTKLKYPAAPRKPVTETYKSAATSRLKVVDDYRWLENPADPEVKRFSDEQTRLARTYLGRLPGLLALRERVRTIAAFPAPELYAVNETGGVLFAMKFEPPKQQPLLVTLESFESGKERVLVDPNVLDPTGGTPIDFYVPSRDGALVAVSMSKGGSEAGDVSVWDVASGRRLPDLVPRVNGGTAGGSLAWDAGGTGFYYTRYPREGERPPEDLPFYQQLYHHKIGTPTASDRYVLGKDFPKIAEISLKSSRDGAFLLVTMSNGDGGDREHWLRTPDGAIKQLATYSDEVTSGRFGTDGGLYLVTRKGAPRGKLLRVPLEAPSLASAATVVPESPAVVRGAAVCKSRVYTLDLVGGPSQVRAFGLDGKELGAVPLPPATDVGQALCLPGSDDLFFRAQGYTAPPAWYRFTPRDGKVEKSRLATPSPVDMSNVEVLRETAISKDGTRVPMTILTRKGTPRDGSNPALLYGYGGYGVSETPSFSATRAVWLEQGGVLAIANLRGGGEFGEEWHRAGNLERKQNVFDDFLACAERLIELKLTRPERLAILGGSNGGLLMGAALTQRPDLFRAVVSFVGIYDMLRVETSPNGAFNVTEFGTVNDPAQLKALYAYSPYHRVKDGTAYPALLLITGENDPRVEPWHSRKFAARLQAATSSAQPILLATSGNAGHGVGSSLDQEIDNTVDMYAFLFDRLGVVYKRPAKK